MRYEDRFTSQVIQALAYDQSTRQLCVFFAQGDSVYVYEGVPPLVHDQLLSAPSKGSYFRERIRGIFRSVRLSEVQRRALEACIAAQRGTDVRNTVIDWLGLEPDHEFPE